MSGKRKRRRKAPAVKTKTPILDLVVIADTHCGCQLGLMSVDAPVRLDGGGTYRPSKFQRMLYDIWLDFWDWVETEATKGRPYAVVFDGDAMDGVHHDSTTQITHNLADQQRIAYDLLKPVVERCEGRFFMIRGTEAHSGPSAENEERLAQALGAVPTDEGLHSRYEIRFSVGGEIVHISHHIGQTTSAAYETSALQRAVVKALNDAARWGWTPPSVVIRAHRHRGCGTRVPAVIRGTGKRGRMWRDLASGNVYGIVTPGWQGKTPYAYRLGSAGPAQFGGVVIRQGADGRVYPLSYTVPVGEEAVVEVWA